MKATRELVRVLRDAATYIEENPEEYNWGNPETCNSGILTKVLLGREFDIYIEDIFYSPGDTWSGKYFKSLAKCQTTGLPLPYIFQELRAIGIETVKDMEEIEFLGDITWETYDQDIDDNLYRNAYFKKADHVIDHFRNLADVLESQLVQEGE